VPPLSRKKLPVDMGPFSVLTDAERAELAQHSESREFRKGDFLFRSGDPVHGIYCLGEGAVKILQEVSAGHEVALRFACRGEWVGHRSVFTSDTYRGSAQARGRVTASFVPTALLTSLFGRNRTFADRLIRLIARDLEGAERRLMEYQRLNVPSRLILLFRSLDEKFGVRAANGRRLSVALTKVELSELIGASQEVVIRQLSKWKRERLIEETGKRFLLSDRLLERVVRDQ
jgi:CRP-like cAMP-binding protein